MRKHFLLLFLMALLPLASFATTDVDYTVGDYTVTFAAKPYVAIAETPSATAIPTFTLKKTSTSSNIDFTIVDLRYQSIGNKVNQISAAGTYFQKITFTDGTADKVMYVPFYVSETYDVDYVNDETSFNASLANGFLKKYYEKYPFCDVMWTYTGGSKILYPGEYPTPTAGTKTGTGFNWNTSDQTKADAVAWANEIFGSTYSAYNIAHTFDAFYAVVDNQNRHVNVPAFGFVFPNLSGEYNVVITDGTNSHTWDAAANDPMEFTAGKYSWTSPTADLNTWGITTATPANVKYIVYPTNLESLAYVPDYSQAVDISNVPVFININSTALNYKDSQNEPTIDNVTVGEITYSSTEWPQLFTLQYYKIVNGVAVKQNADQVQNAGTYAVALVSKGATDADRSITYTNDKESSKAEFVINKINLEITLGDGSKQYGDADPDELPVTAGTLPEGCVSIPDFTFNSLPRTANENVSSTGYAYAFTLNDATQTDITAQNYNLIIKNQPKLTISKKDIVLNYKASAAQPSKTYGVATLNIEFTNGIKDKANYEVATGNALVGIDDLATVLAGLTANKVSTAFNYVGGIESANADKEGTAFTTTTPVAHKLTITIDQDVAANYNFTVNKVALTVKQAKLFTPTATTTAPFTFAKDPTTALTYNAATQRVNKSLIYTANNTYLLNEGATPAVTPQVVVTYKVKPLDQTTDATNNATDTKAAGIYEAYVTPVENGNFYVETSPLRVAAFDFTIDKKPLYLYVKNEEIKETYKGAAYDLPTSAGITFQGLIANDASVVANDITAVKAVKFGTTDVVTLKDAGEYDIIPYVADASSLNTNYDVQPYSTKFTIKPLAITIDPKDMLNVVYGTAIAGTFAAKVDDNTANPAVVGNVTVTKNTTTDPNIVAADLTTVLSAYQVVVANQTYEAGKTYNDAITLVQRTLVPAAATVQNDQAIIDMLKNFTITPGTGNVRIANGTYTIIAKDQNVTYGDELTWSKFTYLVSGLPASTKPASVKYILISNGTDATEYSQNDGDDLPVNAGTYTIKVDAQNSQLAIDNYDAPSLTDGTLTIAPKAITFKLDPATVNSGATKAALKTMAASKVSIVETANTAKAGLAYNNDVIDFDLVYVAGATGTTQTTNTIALVGGTGTDKDDLSNTTPADTYVGGYKIVAPAQVATTAANANYAITWNVTGTLVVAAANVLVLNQQSDDLMNTLEVADDGTTEYNVTLDGLKFGTATKLNAKKWYSMVLPFEISVAQLSSTLGYAIVNRMDQTTSDGNVHFRLTFDKIPANEPFLLKAVKGVNGDQTTAVDINGKPFTGVKIEKPTDVTVSIHTADTNPIVFTAVYEKQHWLSVGDKLYSGLANDNFYEVDKENYNWLDPFRSFWHAPNGARVFVEDLNEDGTTAIKEVNAQTMAEIATDGWYTVNGIKLQSIPTEKGVYIHNGKKVVLK